MKCGIASILLIFAIFLVGCGDIDTIGTDTNETTEKQQQVSVNIYNDDLVSVDFVKIADSVLTGNFELYIKAENKTDKNVTVYLQDVSVNGSMVQVGSGVPCDIIAGANRTHSYFGRLDLAGVTTAKEINKITFKVRVVDEEFNPIITTSDLDISLS